MPVSPVPFATSWRQLVAPYTRPDMRSAMVQVLNTVLPFFVLMGLILAGIDHGFWWALLLSPLAGLMLVRLFMLQHDCGHGSFFPARWANDLLGAALGVLTLTPYKAWRGDHAIHHAGASNLDRRGVGDVTTITLKEYLARSPRGRLAYRMYRHPLVLFGIGPSWCFLITQRIPAGGPHRRWRDWFSVMGTNLALFALGATLVVTLGPSAVLLGWLPVMLTAATLGIWLFYVQHQFEDAYWQPKPSWDFVAAAMQGSSFYDLPRPLHWLTGNIGFHHIHHLSSRIPNYRLRACHEANPEFQAVPRLSMRESLRCASLALWDEERGKLVSFRSLRTRAA